VLAVVDPVVHRSFERVPARERVAVGDLEAAVLLGYIRLDAEGLLDRALDAAERRGFFRTRHALTVLPVVVPAQRVRGLASEAGFFGPRFSGDVFRRRRGMR
jgi:hypothetical protein